MNIGNDWHPVGLSHAIEAGSSAGTRLYGEELVVWRDTGGVAHVWEDRCPHRGMRLSFGFVRGDHIACLYHGWQYNNGGVCQYIPAHPDLAVPNTIKVRVYRTQEQAGMIWSTSSENPLPIQNNDETIVPLRSLYIDCSRDEAIAALSAVPMRPFAPQGRSDTSVNRITDNLYAVSCGSDRLLVGVQTIAAARTALHLTICGSPDTYKVAGQFHFLDWALRLRHSIEQPLRPDVAARGTTQHVA